MSLGEAFVYFNGWSFRQAATELISISKPGFPARLDFLAEITQHIPDPGMQTVRY